MNLPYNGRMIVRAFYCLSVAVTLGLAPIAESASMQCGQTLISDGDSKFEVVARCGEPASKERRTVVVRERLSSGHEKLVEKVIEEWTYNFGSHRLLQVVIFENGIVVDVRSGRYGK